MEDYEQRAVEMCEECDTQGYREVILNNEYLGFERCRHENLD